MAKTDENHHINPREVKTFIDKRMDPKLEPLGVTPAQGYFLLSLSNMEGASLKEIAFEMNIDKSLCTRNTKWLLDNGYVENKPEGKAKFSLYLTEKGRKASEATEKCRKEVWGELLKYVSEEEKNTFIEVTKKIKKAIDEDTK